MKFTAIFVYLIRIFVVYWTTKVTFNIRLSSGVICPFLSVCFVFLCEIIVLNELQFVNNLLIYF